MIEGVCKSRLAWIKATGRGEVWTSSLRASVSYGTPIGHESPKLAQLSRFVDACPQVYAIDNGVFYTDTPYHFSEDGIVFLDTVERYAISYAQSDVWHLAAKRRIKYSGTTAHIACHGYFNLSHFLSDFLPRYWLIKQSPFKVDRWLVPSTLPDWGLDLLRLAGMRDTEMLIGAPDTQIIAERAVTADATGAATWPARWVRTAISELFPVFDEETRAKPIWLWISRSETTRRRWIQEGATINEIRAAGFDVVRMEQLAVEEQIRLAQNSEVIAGPHGAGLSWVLLTARTRGLLFEVVDDTVVQNSFRALAGLVGWRYARTGASILEAGEGNSVYEDITRESSVVMETLHEVLRPWKTDY
ncbi:glycosyltransferase 61 family protein [Hoeflea sp. AS60]|uniref:glycosyltransferase family 61 protein n=1 Tax=Hoeflea sp. AS60 TaxID=3135780 RepID=UPI00316E19C4